MSIVLWIALGGIAGYLTALLVQDDEGLGVVGHVALGIVGAVLGGFLGAMLFDVDPVQGPLDAFSAIAAVIGGVLVAMVVGTLLGRSRTGREAA